MNKEDWNGQFGNYANNRAGTFSFHGEIPMLHAKVPCSDLSVMDLME